VKGFVLVTGAARRIGRAIALRLAKDGFDIVVHYHRSADEAAQVADDIIALGRKAVLAEIDLAKTDQVAKLIPALGAELGPLAALVNNASLFELDKDDPTCARHMAINAEAPRLLSEAFYSQVPDGATGSIVNILDGVAQEKNLNAYYASKAKLRATTLSMAKSFAPRVRVNGIAPGPVLANIRQSVAHFQAEIDATPLKTRIAPDDISCAVSFLAVSRAITGQILYLDGGMHLLT